MNNTNQNTKELATANILPKKADVKKPAERQKEPRELEIARIKPPEEKRDVPLEEKPIPPAETIPPSKEIEIKPRIKRKPRPNRKPKSKPQLQIPDAPKESEEKWVNVNGERVLFVPIGFEIMTKNGWRPIMTRADKIQK